MIKRNVEEFAKSAVTCLYDLDVIGVNRHLALTGMVAEIEELLKLNEVQTLKRRHQHFNIAGTTFDDFEEHFYEVGKNKNVLAGIRHVNASKDQPFVHALLDFSPENSDIELLRDFATTHFKKFAPKFVSLWLRPSLQIEALKNAASSRQYVAASLAEIQKNENPPRYDRISLKRIENALDFNWYTEVYEDFHADHPDLKDWVPINDKEEMDRCISDQLLCQVFVDGTLAGLIGAQNEPLLGIPSVYMTELLLTSKFKGQGLAAAIQRKFLDELPSQFKLVWGTIDSKNLPSLKTALRVGRNPIRSEYFISLL